VTLRISYPPRTRVYQSRLINFWFLWLLLLQLGARIWGREYTQIRLSQRIKSLSNDSDKPLFWGDSLCVMSLGASISLFSLFYIRFLEISQGGGVKSSGFLIYLLPAFLVPVYFCLLIYSNLANKKHKIGFANFLGSLSLIIHIVVCFFNKVILDSLLSIN